MQHYIFFTSVLVVCSAFVFTGCNNPDNRFVKVAGTITYNGQAVDGATITFASVESGGESASGVTDAGGKYTLTSSGTVNAGTGVLPGEYIVRVSKTLSTYTPDPDEEAERKGEITYDELQKRLRAKKNGSTAKVKHQELLPVKYGQPGTTPLKATVVKGTGTHNFDLTD